MKKISVIMLMMLNFSIHQGFAQCINWKNLQKEQKHIVTLHAGWDYGFVAGVAYNYQLTTKSPTLLTISWSLPGGSKLFDDFKAKVGGRKRFYQIKNFQFSTSVEAIYRRYESPLVRLQNIGAETNLIAGYYKSKWFIAAEAGFDVAMFTHFKHTDTFKKYIYADVQDGWYSGVTGGNFLFGIQGGYSVRRNNVTLKIGKVVTQSFNTTPLVPYYLQLGYNVKLKSKI